MYEYKIICHSRLDVYFYIIPLCGERNAEACATSPISKSTIQLTRARTFYSHRQFIGLSSCKLDIIHRHELHLPRIARSSRNIETC